MITPIDWVNLFCIAILVMAIVWVYGGILLHDAPPKRRWGVSAAMGFFSGWILLDAWIRSIQ